MVRIMLKFPKPSQLSQLSQIFSKRTNSSILADDNATTKPKKRTENRPSAYRHLSGKGLSLAVKAQILGEVPELDDDIPTFYVLREYSRSNSLLVDIKTRELDLPSALASTTVGKNTESASVIF